jgi:hypothetical protein
MRRLYLSAFAILLFLSSTAQPATIDDILKNAPVDTIARYDGAGFGFGRIAIKVPYAHRRLVNAPPSKDLKKLIIESVELVYSDYPKNNERFQRQLNRARLQQLAEILPGILELPADRWRFIEQTACRSRAEAEKLFHGFVLTVSPAYELPDFVNEAELIELAGQDNTVSTIIDRNSHWKKMLVVTDLTSSMAPYTAQLLLWFKLVEKRNNVEHFVFFNDGDDIPDTDKKIGETGGIYDGKARSFEEIAELANLTVQNGFGGDIPENNVEALIHGLEVCPDCEEVIMIADNLATPRDMELIGQVDRPVRVILCGADPGVNPAYLDMAYRTGGSLHTIEEDIVNLLEISEGEEIQIGKEIFRIKNGKFELVKKS